MNSENRWSLLALASIVMVVQQGSAAGKTAHDLAGRIDRAVDEKLKAEKVAPSPEASDAEFLRRVSLDITGVIPTAERTKLFLDSSDPDKRAKLIDELLASPEYGKRMADVWQALLLARAPNIIRYQPSHFAKWLADSFNSNKPWDRMVREVLTATGTEDDNPVVIFYLANDSVDKLTDNVTKNLLGVQLQCAQCHNHPFTAWKQTEYWAMAAFFMKVRADNANRAVRQGSSPGVSEGPQINRNRRALPESAKMVPAKFLGGEQPKLIEREAYRPIVADWITSPKNPYFARAMANRVWAMMFGRGIVNPVDDMHEGNEPSHPELLKDLADGFIASGFDVKELIRAVALGKTYQRSSKPVEGNADTDRALLARMPIKVLPAEMLFDSLVQVSGSAPVREGRPARQGRGPAAGPRQQFVNFFRADEGADPTEYNHGIPQALRVMNSAQFNRTTLVDQLTRNGPKPEEAIERLFLSVLSRRPTSAETTRFTAHLTKAGLRSGCNDVLWVLLNSSECVVNR